MKHLSLLVAAALLVATAEVAAQSAYVGASVFGDIVRLSGNRAYGTGDASRGGEAIGFTIRVGGVLSDRWGIEAEFARPSEIEVDDSPLIYPALTRFVPTGELVAPGLPAPLIFPPIQYRSVYRNTTISTSAWVRQDLTASSSLVYLGGLSFYRSDHSLEYVYDPRALIAVPPGFSVPAGLSILPYTSESVFYGVKPFVGVEGRMGLSERVQFVPGLRLHAIEGGWLVRPGVGLNWMF